MHKKYPFICKEHPGAKVKHTWDEDFFRSGQKLGNPVARNEKFTCAICGKRLAPSQKEAICREG